MDKPPLQKRLKRKLKVKIKRRTKQDENMYIPTPLSESSPLVIHATYREPDQKEAHLEEAKKTMYLSHLVAKFSELGWQFCLILFLTALTNYKSLTLVSTYGLFTGIVVCLSGPSAGAEIDNRNRDRLSIAQLFIWVQNLSVIIATTCCFFLLRSAAAVTTMTTMGVDGENPTFGSDLIPDLAPPATMKTWLLLIALHIFGAFGKLTDQSMTVALERDWIVVMSKVARGDSSSFDSSDSEQNIQSTLSQDSDVSSLSAGNASLGSHTDMNNTILHDLKEKTWLAQTNTVMKQIDLICRVAAPAAAGIFFAFFDNYKAGDDVIITKSHWDNLSYAATIIGFLNLASLFVENSFIRHIYELVPSLSIRSDPIPKVVSKINFQEDDGDRIEKLGTNRFGRNGERRPKLATIQSGIVKIPSVHGQWDVAKNDKDEEAESNNGEDACKPFSLYRGLSVYMKQPIAFGGIALSLLYLNVLCFGALMTAYLVFRGLSYGTIGALRGVASVIGLMGTLAYNISSRRNTLSFTGAWSITFQFSCLTLCYGSLYVTNDKFSIALLIIGVIASRIGLYVFDLTITQMMQQMIPEDVRGLVGGVQKSLNGFFELSTYALGLFYSRPDDFYVLVATGFASVGLAMCIYLWGIHKFKADIENS